MYTPFGRIEEKEKVFPTHESTKILNIKTRYKQGKKKDYRSILLINTEF